MKLEHQSNSSNHATIELHIEEHIWSTSHDVIETLSKNKTLTSWDLNWADEPVWTAAGATMAWEAAKETRAEMMANLIILITYWLRFWWELSRYLFQVKKSRRKKASFYSWMKRREEEVYRLLLSFFPQNRQKTSTFSSLCFTLSLSRVLDKKKKLVS